ncbi:MAG TPA: hypothetical protein VGQ09_06355 [Chitinophagaceae bacterium]|jgi:hypothetical protein|nr:hypothetical protein [Chitinophagaceae bacterium]
MNIKLTLPVIFVFVQMLTICSFGQQQSSISKATIIKGADSLKVSLHLSDEQTQKFREINSAFVDSLTVINQSSESILIKGEKRKGLFKSREEALKKLLTLEQYQQYRAIIDAKRRENENKAKELRKTN